MTYEFSRSTRFSSHESTPLAVYQWIPTDCTPIGAVVLCHGFRSHTRYNFLRNEPPSTLHQYENSFISALNSRKLAVFGQDYIGHGESQGLRAYFPSIDVLIKDILSYVTEVQKKFNKPPRIFLVAHSLGGTLSILCGLQAPKDLIRGILVSSAATEPPANMLGLKGRFLKPFAGIATKIIPTWEVLDMPGNTENPELQELFESDPLNSTAGLRVRVGSEFLKAYQKICEQQDKVDFPFLSCSGGKDTLVDPDAAERFYKNAKSKDKKWIQRKDNWHNLLQEPGKEDVWTLFVDWIVERC